MPLKDSDDLRNVFLILMCEDARNQDLYCSLANKLENEIDSSYRRYSCWCEVELCFLCLISPTEQIMMRYTSITLQRHHSPLGPSVLGTSCTLDVLMLLRFVSVPYIAVENLHCHNTGWTEADIIIL
jgi:hypothetical protein